MVIKAVRYTPSGKMQANMDKDVQGYRAPERIFSAFISKIFFLSKEAEHVARFCKKVRRCYSSQVNGLMTDLALLWIRRQTGGTGCQTNLKTIIWSTYKVDKLLGDLPYSC